MYRALVTGLLFTVACQQNAAAPHSPPAEAATAAPAAPSVDGPSSIKIDPLTLSTTPADIEKGKQIFTAKGCPACHKTDESKLVGPGLKGITARRSIPWIQRMVLNPDLMVKEDPIAKQLLGTHFTPMPAQGVDPKAELPFLISYLKTLEK